MGKAKKPADVYPLKIILRGTDPPVWRRVETKDCTVGDLHQLIQLAMGWYDEHMHAFEVGEETYGVRDRELEFQDEDRITLSQLVARVVKKFRYEYDFGDSWEHVVRVEKVLDAVPGVRYPVCVGGARACPPEDCGGDWGYYDLIEALKGPKTERQEELLEMWGDDSFDPEAFDLEAVNKSIRKVRFKRGR